MPSNRTYRRSSFYEGRPSFARQATYLITAEPSPARSYEAPRPILVERRNSTIQSPRRRLPMVTDYDLGSSSSRRERYPVVLHAEHSQHASRNRAVQSMREQEWAESRLVRRSNRESVRFVDREPDDYAVFQTDSIRRTHFEPQLVEHKKKKYYRDEDGNWLRWRKVEREGRSSKNFFTFL